MPVPTSITDIVTTAASNSPQGSDSIGNPGKIDDYFRGIQAVFRAETVNKTWERWNHTPTFISATQFSVATDLTNIYTVGRRVKCTVTAGTVYGRISASAFGAVTTVTVVLDSGNLDSGLSEVQLGPELKGLQANTAGLAVQLSDGRTGTGAFVCATSPTFGTSVTLPLGSITTTQWLIGTALGASRRFEARLAAASALGVTIGTNDFAAGTTGTGLYFDFGAASGNTTSRINALTSGGAAAGDLVFNDGFSGKFVMTSDGRLYGQALHNNAGAVTGTTNQYIASGTYTPTGTSVANLTANTPDACQWIRVGNAVTVSGSTDANVTTTATTTDLGLSLPIASTLSAANKLGGTGAWAVGDATAKTVVGIYADTTNNRANLRWTPNGTGNQKLYFSFTYLIS